MARATALRDSRHCGFPRRLFLEIALRSAAAAAQASLAIQSLKDEPARLFDLGIHRLDVSIAFAKESVESLYRQHAQRVEARTWRQEAIQMPQRTIGFFLSLAAIIGSTAKAEEADLEILKRLYEADQAARSEENRRAGKYPTLQQERDRRFTVFELIADGKLQTADDYFHAGMILHHTSGIKLESGEMVSLGTESKLLAFFLFRRASQLGHDFGRPMMGAAYNYYLDACGEDASKYGYEFEGHDVVWRPNVDEEDRDTLKCGFDPRRYLD